MDKLLTICIPTYNRCNLLKQHLNNVLMQLNTFESDDVEVVVSVNPSGDGTEEMLSSFLNCSKLRININSSNIGGTNNIIKLFTISNSRYVWIAADDDILIDGIIKKVVIALRKHHDINWLFINSARSRIEKQSGHQYMIEGRSYYGKGGYYKKGLKKLNEVFKKSSSRVLFSTSNVYLRDAALSVANNFTDDNNCRQLVYIYNSIGTGSAYVIEEPSIIAGSEISWADRKYETAVYNFNAAVLKIGELPQYSKNFAIGLIRYRMTHDAMIIWLMIYTMILKDFKIGISSLKWYFELIPITTVLMTITAPIWLVYVFVRHNYKEWRNKNEVKKMKNDVSIPIEFRERC